MRFHPSPFLASVLTLGLVCVAVLAQQKTGIARDPIRPIIVNSHDLDGVDIRDWALTDYGEDVREINLDGLKKILARDSGDKRPLLLNFWATWCDPCREEFPDLVKLDADYKDKALNFIAISLDDITDIKSEVPKFLNQMKATMPVVLLNVKDPEPAIKVVDATWDGQLPATFLYDKDGKVVFKHFGKIKPDELRAAIDKEIKH
jgi:thiol-disulfide isomerase/thioredoxin